jgi:hypothetical protein
MIQSWGVRDPFPWGELRIYENQGWPEVDLFTMQLFGKKGRFWPPDGHLYSGETPT